MLILVNNRGGTNPPLTHSLMLPSTQRECCSRNYQDAAILGAYTFGTSSTSITTQGTSFNSLSPGAYNVTPTVFATMTNGPAGFNPSARVRILVFAHSSEVYKTIFVFSSDTHTIYKAIYVNSLIWRKIEPTAIV